ncbi:uncharacterized protein BP5553_04637 [Venustampulla echinocandica]|uniref:TORC1 subunit TCO89 n=1 Tax=Venustampulla echinocandica TaxID=2656787 RepID=A0A370TNV3_9HELO|nr:uncharacterized protein BP5553_04637 [Venustampulla echinocandica]RDL37204.1 hypothetical protein BP5553_04637 [Venustampulla echinocandica]
MPSELMQSQSQAHPPTRPAASHQRSASSTLNESIPTSPSRPQHDGGAGAGAPHGTKPPKAQKHVVQHHHGGLRTHTRVPSSKTVPKLSRAHDQGSLTDLKKAAVRNSSATNLTKRHTPSSALKRNRSSADIPRRPRSPKSRSSDEAKAKAKKKVATVQFELGDEQEQDDEDADAAEGWEEASSSASPALSRTVSRNGRLNDNGSGQASPLAHPQSPSKKNVDDDDGGSPLNGTRKDTDTSTTTTTTSAADAKSITERLLKRVPSYHATTTKMSLATATPTTVGQHSSSSSSLVRTPQIGSKEDVISRFVTGSGTPSDNSPLLQHHRNERHAQRNQGKDEVKRAQSMGNLTNPSQSQPQSDESDEERAILPRSRKSSTSTAPPNSAYNPPQQSRTQQKLWLQRASSNIEPAQMTPGSGAGLVGDGRDPRIRLQLEKTGLEYLVVRRYQDPVGKAVRRLEKLPGMESVRERRIPKGRESRRGVRSRGDGVASAHGSFDARRSGVGSLDSLGGGEGRQDDDCVDAILRSLWEKSYDLSASED